LETVVLELADEGEFGANDVVGPGRVVKELLDAEDCPLFVENVATFVREAK